MPTKKKEHGGLYGRKKKYGGLRVTMGEKMHLEEVKSWKKELVMKRKKRSGRNGLTF